MDRFRQKNLGILLLIGMALLLRFGRYLSGDMANDASFTGRLGYSILDGIFPLFSLGQKFMGSLDAYLSAPFYLLAGPSVLTLNLVPLLCSIGTLAFSGLYLKKVLGRPGFFLGLLYLALPPALWLYWAAEARSYYPVALLLSALLMGISFRAGTCNRTFPGLIFFGWGLLAGVAFWTNFLTGVVIGGCFLYLGLGLKKKLLGAPLGLMAGGAVLGAGPLLVFSLTRGMPWLGIVPPDPNNLITTRIQDLFFNSLPIVLGINPVDNQVGLAGQPYTLGGYLLVLGLVVWGLVGLTVRGWKSRDQAALLPVFILILNLAAALIGGRPPDYREQDQRYLLPLYLGLPFCWGYLADRLAGRRKALAVLLLIMAGTHISGYITFLGAAGGGWGGGPLLGLRSGYYGGREGPARTALHRVREEGWEFLYSNTPQFGFLAGRRPLLAGLIGEDNCLVGARVDGSLHPGFWMSLEPNFRLLGLPYRASPAGIYHLTNPLPDLELLTGRGDWQARSLDGASLGQTLSDGDLATGFITGGDNPDGQGFCLDLGRPETVGGLILVSTNYREVPAGLRIETSLDNRRFQMIREVRDYWGPFYLSGPHPFLKMRYSRVEGYFPHQAFRYLKVTQLGNIRPDWPVGEVFLLAPGPKGPEVPWTRAADLLVATVSRHSFKKIYADAWPSALLFHRLDRKSGLVPPNRYADNYGSEIPSPVDPLILDPAPGSGLILSNREAGEAAERLRLAGIGFRTEPAGRYTLFALLGTEEGTTWPLRRVSSEQNPGEAALLAQGLPPGKRWSTGAPQQPGQGLTIDLGEMRELAFVTLGCPHHPRDFPRGLRAQYSLNGYDWPEASLRQVEPLVFTGQFLLLFRGPMQRYRLTPVVRARYLRLTLDETDPEYWWSVEFLRISGRPGRPPSPDGRGSEGG